MKRGSKKMPKDFNLYLIGDFHDGNLAFARDRLKKDIGRIKRDKKGYVVLMGDLCESIHLGDPRYQPDVHAGYFETVNAQAKDVAELLIPIKDRILAILEGNHELKIAKTVNATELIMEGLGIDVPMGFTVKLSLTPYVKVFLCHGAGVVRSRAGDRKQVEVNDGIRIKRKLKDLAGDCVLMAMGHIHTCRVCKPERHLALVDDPDGNIKGVYPSMSISPEGVVNEEDRWYCSTASYLRGYMDGITTYAERAMYPPAEMGGVRAEIRDDRLMDVKKWL